MKTTQLLTNAAENAKRLASVTGNLYEHMKPLAQAGRFDASDARTLREMVQGLMCEGERLMQSIDALVLPHLKSPTPPRKEKK